MGVTSMAERFALIEALEPRTLLAADPMISEFQAINVSTLQDEDGDYEDWIEIRNPDVTSANVGGWYLTDDDEDLTKWQFPANTTIEAGKEILVFASNKDRTDGPQGQLHTNFRLTGDGEYPGPGQTGRHDDQPVVRPLSGLSSRTRVTVWPSAGMSTN